MRFGKVIKKTLRALTTELASVQPGQAHTLPGNLIVSLTSYPPRFQIVHLTLRSLLSQDIRPDALILWVAHQDLAALPERVRGLQRYGLIICSCEDYRQYKKIVPALLTYPHAFIVTADDDMHYPRGWLRRFVDAYRSPKEVLCQRARRMLRSGHGYLPYEQWPRIAEDGATGSEVFFTGVGGVLYPPGALAPQTTDAAQFMQLCPTADDVWLHWMVALGGSTVRFVKPGCGRPSQWLGGQESALWRINCRRNDDQIAAMIAAYGLPDSSGGLPLRDVSG